MASIRRTQSPFHNHSLSNPFSPILKPNSKPNPLSYISRKLRSSFYKYLLFFFALGFLIGLVPFRYVENDVKNEFRFENSVKNEKNSVKNIENEVKFENGVKFEYEVSKVRIDKVELGLEKEKVDLFDDRKLVIIVTATYNRGMQAYFLNRLGQGLKLVKMPLLWVVVEMNEASVETAGMLRKMGVMYRHLVCKKNSTDAKDRGVHQRNTALEHIERHRLDGIVYFADDDNVYSLELFESLREIRRFGTWPVAMLAQSKNKAILEGPICNGNNVVGWHTNEKSKRLRRFHVDMSGFAFNSTILWDPIRWRRPTANPIRQLDTVKEGFQETTFIEQLVEDEYQMEGIGPSCSRIMNWHLHLEARKFTYPRGWMLQKNLDVLPTV